jgi:diguanylate cyclase (GGDEF)-like protein
VGRGFSAQGLTVLSLDPRTIILLAGVMGVLMSVVLFFLRRNYPPSIKGLGEWSAAAAIIFVSTLLFGTRGVVPDFFSVVVANLVLLTGLSLLYFGSQRFLGMSPSIRLWGGLIVAAAPVLVWYTHVEPHYGIRLLVMTLLMTLLSFSHARLIMRHGTRGFATFLTVAALLIQMVVQALRFGSAFSTLADSILLDPSPTQTAYITTYAFCMLMITIGVVLMATDRLRAELEHLATHDSLTGALNRRALIEAGTLELARCRRNHQVMALLVMDLDHFKAINDTHGHQTGDRVLVDFAGRVTHLLRQVDRFGRFGGEEFVVLLPETSLAEARLVAERIRAEVEAGNKELPACTVSIGVAVSGPDDLEVDGIVARADAAMYRAKEGGRNRVETALP